jgi:hypothetical protein
MTETKKDAAAERRKENMALWNSVFVTDPEHTKPFSRAGGFRGTAIKPYWLVKRATETFGPHGIGWGHEEHDVRVVEGPEGRVAVFSKVSVWYLSPTGQRAETGPQWGGTLLVDKRKDGGLFMDDEAFKKSITDGITKCLSYIGFAGDVHMGLFDGSKYVADATDHWAGKKADEDDPIEAEAAATAKKWRDDAVAGIKGCKTTAELEKFFTALKATKLYEVYKADPKQKGNVEYVVTQAKRRAAELKQDAAAEAADEAAQPEAA